MFETGTNILVTLVSGYNPAFFVGRVTRPCGPEGAEIEKAVMVKQSPGHKWAKLANGDQDARQEAILDDEASHITFSSCAYFRPWLGELPKLCR